MNKIDTAAGKDCILLSSGKLHNCLRYWIMTKNRFFTFIFFAALVGSLITLMQLDSCSNLPLGADDEKYLDLNEVGVTVLIGPDNAVIVLDISQEARHIISLINYSMDEHALVLKSPTQTRSIYVMSQLQIGDSEVVHLQDRTRLVIHCKKPI